MIKKRVKKYNSVEAARKNNERILKGFAVCYFVNDNTPKQDIILTNLKGERVQITKTMSEAITCHRYKWQIYLCAGTVNTKDEKELKVEPVVCKQPYLQSELVGFLNEQHSAFFADLKSKNVRIEFGGWIARASGRELEPKEMFNMFDKLEAWPNDRI